ncbi:Hypothetical predicted protein [Podarcis lilfordi]|uniref:Uncharacterized protein n=1 Tax=Podarcis lilfordi TaxID=74358 RepID=A0AA35JUM0_9SAUR|nr:Hypothetical predicted protein [Podarcis lilfordi]
MPRPCAAEAGRAGEREGSGDACTSTGSLSGKMKDLQEKGPLIEEIWDLLLSQFGVAASKELQQAITKCSLQQARALEFLQSKQQRGVSSRTLRAALNATTAS